MPQKNNNENENVLAYIGRTVADEFKKINIIPKTILITLLVTALITYFLLPVVSKYGAEMFIQRLNNPTNEELKKSAFQLIKRDSLAKIKSDSLQSLLIQIDIKNRKQIQFRAFQIERQLKNCIAVNYFAVHNGSERVGLKSQLYYEIYISSRQANEEDFRFPPVIYEGFRWLGDEIKKNGIVYIDDVRNYPKLYNGKTKDQLDIMNVKSFIAIFIQNNKDEEVLFASIDFSVYNGLEENPDLYFNIINFKRFILQRIN